MNLWPKNRHCWLIRVLNDSDCIFVFAYLYASISLIFTSSQPHHKRMDPYGITYVNLGPKEKYSGKNNKYTPFTHTFIVYNIYEVLLCFVQEVV